MAPEVPVSEEHIEKVRRVLCREHGDLNWLEHLTGISRDSVSKEVSAIGLDTNALKHLRRDLSAQNDVLVQIEAARTPVIVPGQAMQEYWNNHAAFLADVGNVVSSLDNVLRKIERVQGAGDPRGRIEQVKRDVQEINAEFQDTQNPQLMSESIEFWQKLNTVSFTPFVPRLQFADIGRLRFETKTPPGFADEKKIANQLGDFFVWADLLLGLASLELDASTPRRVLFVTGDVKEDWYSFGVPHPVLIGEMFAVSGQVLQLMRPEEFVKLMQESS